MVEAGYKGARVKSSGNDIIMILAFVAGLIIVFYVLAKREVGNLAGDAADSLSGAVSGAVNAVTAIPSQISGAIQARELSQEQVIAQAAGGSQLDYNKMVSAANIGYIPSTMVYYGNVIAPSSLLEGAAAQGADFRNDLIANNDLQRYQDLNPVSKGLVTLGEGLTRTFTGLSPYEAGVAVKNWWDSW